MAGALYCEPIYTDTWQPVGVNSQGAGRITGGVFLVLSRELGENNSERGKNKNQLENQSVSNEKRVAKTLIT